MASAMRDRARCERRTLRYLHGPRAIQEEQVVDGARRSNLEELTDWTLWADKVVAL